MIVYGIKNCDTVKKALNALDSNNITYDFIDIKKCVPDTHTLQHWCDTVGEEALVNTRGTTWRQLSDADKHHAKQQPIPYIQQMPTLMKRPIIVHDNGDITVGFTAQVQQKLQI